MTSFFRFLLVSLVLIITSTSYVFATKAKFEVRRLEYNPSLQSRWQEDALSALYATVDGVEYLIVPEHPDWNSTYIDISIQEDLDGDGLTEAVVSTSHGGNCCGPNFFVISHRGDGFFSSHTHEDMTGWPSVELNLDYGEKILKVSNLQYEEDQKIQGEQISLFKFLMGELVRVSHTTNSGLINAVLDVTANDVKLENKFVKFDIDGDGLDESIEVKFWERWQTATIHNIESSSKGTMGFSIGCTRIGFLRTKTNGVHDIVCNRNDILRYDLDANRYR